MQYWYLLFMPFCFTLAYEGESVVVVVVLKTAGCILNGTVNTGLYKAVPSKGYDIFNIFN